MPSRGRTSSGIGRYANPKVSASEAQARLVPVAKYFWAPLPKLPSGGLSVHDGLLLSEAQTKRSATGGEAASVAEIELWQDAIVWQMRRSISRDKEFYSFCFKWCWSLHHHLNPMGFLRSEGLASNASKRCS